LGEQKVITIDEIKQQLQQRQYKFSKPADWERTGIDWYAYKESSNTVFCECNERSPFIVVKPWRILINGDKFESAEINIVGELPIKQWINISIYSVNFDEIIPNIELFEELLSKTWNCAAGVKSKREA